MKSIKIITFLLLSLAFRLHAQDTISYSITTPKAAAQTLTQAADTANIATLRTVLTNLKYLKGVTSPHARGIEQSVNIDFFKVATRIDRGDTVEYILRLVQNGGLFVGIWATLFIPEGSKVYVQYENGELGRTLDYTDQEYINLPTFLISKSNENRCWIHFIVPKTQESKAKMIIRSLVYGFSKQDIDNAKNLQSSVQSSNIDPYTCAYSTCFNDIDDWKMEAGAVFRIETNYSTLGGQYFTDYATGFMLNTSDNYGYNMAAQPCSKTNKTIHNETL